MTIPVSVLHVHDESCIVPLEKLFAQAPPNTKAGDAHYYWRKGLDGRKYVRMSGLYALQGCSEKKIPIFIGRTPPDGLL